MERESVVRWADDAKLKILRMMYLDLGLRWEREGKGWSAGQTTGY